MIEIIPAILPTSLGDLREHLELLQDITPLVQVDVVDGVFARTKTWPYTDQDSFEKIIAEEEGMPFWESFSFEFDLMVAHPEREVEKFIEAGADRLVIHAASEGALEAVRKLQESRGGEFAVEVGVALASHAAVDDLKKFDALYDYVQVMGIDEIGAQGQPPDPHHKELELIKALRAQYPQLSIQVDGGVAVHPRELVEAGASRLIVGGAIIHSENPKGEIRRLYNEANARS